jgi:2,4-dienoyl-CoA reductase (NADPH2)
MYFKNLFEPLSVGDLEASNRLVLPGMHTNLGGDVVGISKKGKDFVVARAEGGFGLVCVGIIDSYPWEFTSDDDYHLSTDRHVKNHAEVTTAVKEHGSIPYAQIGPRRIWPLSEVFGGDHRLSELDLETIEEMIDATVDTAVRAEKAGYEAVDLLGNGAGAISFFMSSKFNDRTDEWGGDLRAQTRFPRLIVERIQEETDLPVFFRLIGHEFLDDGYGTDTIAQMAADLERAGVSFFNVTGGSHATSVPQLPANVPRGAFAHLACEIKQVVDVPVAASNRISDPHTAEELVRDGWADAISLGRAALADPEWPNKAREGRLEDINLCIACNECLDYATVQEKDIRCLVNPKAGRGLESGELTRAPEPKKVLVAGGGVVGMHAALACDERGHDVTLCEKTEHLGGKWRVSYAPTGRRELVNYLQWLTTQLNDSAVAIELETPVTPDLVRSRSPDAMIGCFGGVPKDPPISGISHDHVHYVHEVLDGDVTIEPGSEVTVIGGGGAGVEAALYLATQYAEDPETAIFLNRWDAIDRDEIFERIEEGHDVTVIGRNDTIGVGLGASTKWVLRKELSKLDVRTLSDSAATAITEDGVEIESEDGEDFVSADRVVLAVGYDTPSELYEGFEDAADEVYFVGDVVDPDHAIEGTGRVQEIAMDL